MKEGFKNSWLHLTRWRAYHHHEDKWKQTINQLKTNKQTSAIKQVQGFRKYVTYRIPPKSNWPPSCTMEPGMQKQTMWLGFHLSVTRLLHRFPILTINVGSQTLYGASSCTLILSHRVWDINLSDCYEVELSLPFIFLYWLISYARYVMRTDF